MALEFTTRAKKRDKDKPIVFTLDGEKFDFRPPKSTILVLAVLESQTSGEANADSVKALFDYLSAGLSAEDNQRIIDRLKDPEDDLDIEEVGQILEGIIEEVGNRPTK